METLTLHRSDPTAAGREESWPIVDTSVSVDVCWVTTSPPGVYGVPRLCRLLTRLERGSCALIR